MALFTQQGLRDRVSNQFAKGGFVGGSTLQKAEKILNESFSEHRSFPSKTFDIFLSHSSTDATIVAGLKLELEDLGYTVYVDWIEDPNLDRGRVTKETARHIQHRMHNCNSLFYAFTDNAIQSKWMPWELGYFDGLKHKAAVLPILQTYKDEYRGTEYVGIYNYITKENLNNTDRKILWVNESKNIYVSYDEWIKNTEPYKHLLP